MMISLNNLQEKGDWKMVLYALIISVLGSMRNDKALKSSNKDNFKE
jgi:hypothetical protein